MKFLIVINRNPRRSDYLEKLIRASVSSVAVTHLTRGMDLRNGLLESHLVASGPFDLMLYHCGGTNTEYAKVVEAYRTLCGTKGWRQPGIILFSGDPAAVTAASVKYSLDPAICVTSQRNLEANLQPFLQSLARAKPVEVLGEVGTNVPYELLEGRSEMDIALQALSALLPFGIVWAADELSGNKTDLKEAAKGLAITLFLGLERVMVERFNGHLQGQSGQTWDAKVQKEILVLDSLLVRASKNPLLVEQWKEDESGADGLPPSLDFALKTLAESKTIDQWNARLRALRDSLLVSPDEN